MESTDILIKDGIVVTVDSKKRIFKGSVVIKDDKIIAVGKTDTISSKYKAEKVISAHHKAVMPGFIDLHNHLRGLTPGISRPLGKIDLTKTSGIDEMLKASFKNQEYLDIEQFYAGPLLSSVEHIKSGMTCVVDHCYPLNKPGFDEQSLKAFDEVKIRGILARGIMTGPYPPICEEPEEAYKATMNLIEKHIKEKWRIIVAPAAFRCNTLDDFKMAREIANKYDVKLYTHVSESPPFIKTITKKYGKTPIALLHDLGFTGPDVILVHLIYPTEEEKKILQQTNTKFVDCPTNHMRWGKGVTPVPELLRIGVIGGLGCDGPGNLFVEMRNEILHQQLHHRQPAIMQPDQAFEMATINGARVLGLSDQIGSLEVGKKADITILDLDKLHLTPTYNIVDTIVNRADAADVDTVLVDGKIIMENRKMKTIDENKVKEIAKKASINYIKKLGMEDLIEKY